MSITARWHYLCLAVLYSLDRTGKLYGWGGGGGDVEVTDVVEMPIMVSYFSSDDTQGIHDKAGSTDSIATYLEGPLKPVHPHSFSP